MSNQINQASMLRVGTMLRGVYRIDRYLSSGGFGNTYVATNVEFDEVVAIKEFFIKGVTQRDSNSTSVSVSNCDNDKLFASQLLKFKKEARRIRKLQNEHIVRVHDLFEENGTAYYVMDYIDGESLAERMDRLQRPLSEGEVMGFYPQILDALLMVHRQGIFHLDLKPANVMVDAQGVVRLIDFGASKQQSNADGANDVNSTLICYTNGYAPREQMERNFEKIGPWTDLYALGATLYALLTHQRPPMPSDIDDDRSADKHLALPLPKGVSAETRSLILRLMKTDRMDRPQSAEALLATDVVKTDDHEDDDITITRKDDDEETLIIQSGQKKTEDPQPPVGPGKDQPPVGPGKKPGKDQPDTPDFVSKYGRKITMAFVGVFLAVLVVAGIVNSVRSHSGFNLSGDDLATVAQLTDSVDSVFGDAAYEMAEDMSYSVPTMGDGLYTGGIDDEGLPHDPDGVFKIAEKDIEYRGTFVHGVAEGKATYKIQNQTFQGTFKDNEYAQGTLTDNSSGAFFEGTFSDGQPYNGAWYTETGQLDAKVVDGKEEKASKNP